MPERYIIAVPVDAANGQWLQELETWRQRTGNSFDWLDTPIGNQWSSKIIINGTLVNEVEGKGGDKKAARTQVVIALNDSDPPVFVRILTGAIIRVDLTTY